MASSLSVTDQIRQLNDARKLVLGDVKYYPSVVKGILPIIGPTSAIELRRWGADFLAEAFSTPALPNGEKETMQPHVLDTLGQMIKKDSDPHVLKSVIQTAASIYPLAMRWTINNSYDNVTWEKMMGIKQSILRIWNRAVPSVRICCIKFAQRVVLAQSVASGAESRYGGTLDVSLDKIPPNHQILDPIPSRLRAWDYWIECLASFRRAGEDNQNVGCALLTDISKRCFDRRRDTQRILYSRAHTTWYIEPHIELPSQFQPLETRQLTDDAQKQSHDQIYGENATSVADAPGQTDPHNPLTPRIQQHVEQMMRTVAEVFDESGKKRTLQAPQYDGNDAKRQKVGLSHIQISPLGPGPHSLADVFSLTDTPGLKTFDLSLIPDHLIAKIAVTTLARTDSIALVKATEAVRSRLDVLAKAPVPELDPNTAPLGVEDDDDDYEPDFNQAEDTEQILNKLDAAPVTTATIPAALQDALGLKAYSLPQPQALNPESALSVGNDIVLKVMDMMKSLEDPAGKKSKAGFIRLAASSGNREAWVTMLTRVATRSSTLDDDNIKGEGESDWTRSLATNIRDTLYNFVMEDFRRHIDIAVSWLCEEWFNDKVQTRRRDDCPQHYEKCALRLIDGFLPYLHPQDKVLTRFLSEIPEISPAILSRVKSMCRDPSVVSLALTSLLYLVIMRPPVKEVALDTVQDIWSDHEDARPLATKYLSKYRPAFLEQATKENEDGNGAVAA